VQISLGADVALQQYFKVNAKAIEGWFNVIAPAKKGLRVLRDELDMLNKKSWTEHRT